MLVVDLFSFGETVLNMEGFMFKVGISMQPVREAVSYRGLFTAGWFGVREKHCSRLEIYDRASEQAVYTWKCSLFSGKIWSRKKIYLLPGFDAS